MNKNILQTTRLKLIAAAAATLAIIGILNMIPFGASQEVGNALTTYGIPFTFYSVNSPSYPNAVEVVQFHPEALIANILIGVAVVFLSVYLFRIMKSRRLHNK